MFKSKKPAAVSFDFAQELDALIGKAEAAHLSRHALVDRLEAATAGIRAPGRQRSQLDD